MAEQQQADSTSEATHERLHKETEELARPSKIETTNQYRNHQEEGNHKQAHDDMSLEQKRRRKGKERLRDHDDEGGANEVRSATALRTPDTRPSKNEPHGWVWDRDSAKPASTSHALRSSADSPRGGATKHSPLLNREVSRSVVVSSCCTLS